MFWTSTIRDLQARNELLNTQVTECRQRLGVLKRRLLSDVGSELTAAKVRLAALVAHASLEANLLGNRVNTDLVSNLESAHILLSAEPKPRVAGWRDSWQDWRPGAPCEDDLIRVGEKEEYGVVVPVSIPFIGGGRAIAIRCDRKSSELAAGLLQSIIIRSALLLPHRVVYTLLDPAGNGRAFPMRKHLLPGQVRTSAHEVRRDLESVVTDIREIYEKHLDAQTTSFEQIPSSIRVNLKYQIVCAADFPNQYTSQDIDLLQRIAANGPRAGVYLVLHHNREHAWPRETTMDGFKEVCLLDVNSPSCTLDVAPEPNLQRRLLEVVAAHKPAPPRDDWESICGLNPAEWWTGDSKHMIETPIGLNSNGSRLSFWFGYDTRENRHCVHGIMAGSTGNGKSTLFRNLIAGLAMRYSPDELRLYLIDGKRGAGFHRFKDLPHVEVLSLDTEKQPELARSILSELIEEMRRRNEIIGGLCGKEELWQYRDLKQPHGPLPRILVLVDEYEVLVKGDMEQASEWLRELAKQGRSYGIHMLLSAHLFRMRELTGRDEILAQAQLRAALPLGPQEIEEALEFQREGRAKIAAWCQTPGQIVVNSQNGIDGANREGKVSYLDGDRCVEIVSAIRKKANDTPGGRGSWRAVVFNGTDQPRLLDNRQLLSLLNIPHWPAPLEVQSLASAPEKSGGFGISDWFAAERPCVTWLGQDLNVYGHAKLVFRRRIGEHAAIIGDNNAIRYGMLAVVLASLAANSSPDSMQFYIVDQSVPGSPWSEVLQSTVADVLVPGGFEACFTRDPEEAETHLIWLAEELERRCASRQSVIDSPSIYVILTDIERVPGLCRKPGSYEPADTNAGRHLLSLCAQGAAQGIHVVLSFAALGAMEHVLDHTWGLPHFRHRVCLRMSDSDSYRFLDGSSAGTKVQPFDPPPVFAIHRDRQSGVEERFKPYSLSGNQADALMQDLRTMGRRLAARREVTNEHGSGAASGQ